MPPPADVITDIWFRSPAELEDICARIGMSDVLVDAEDTWAWADGTLDGVTLHLERVHDLPLESANIRVCLREQRAYPPALREKLVERLRPIARGCVTWGRWRYLNRRDYELHVVGEIAASG